MRTVRAVAVVALLGAVAATIVCFTAAKDAGSIAFVLGGVALAAGFTAGVDALGKWGVPGDGH